MRSYTIPADINEKEKIIGGILNINEFLWVLSGFVLGLIVFAALTPLLGQAAIVVGALVVPTGVPFVLVKKEGLTLFEYLKRKREFKSKVKRLPNIRI